MWTSCCSTCENKKSQEPGPGCHSAPAVSESSDAGEVTVAHVTQGAQDEIVQDSVPPEDTNGFFYEVKVERQGLAGLGLQLEASDPRYCFVAGIKADGHIEMWNQRQEADASKVRVCDRLVKVNGVSYPSSVLVTKACAFGSLTLTFQRPRTFQVTVEKKSTWGLDIAAGENGLSIMAIQDGAIQEWNDAHPEKAIQVGDRIVSVAASGSCASGEAEVKSPESSVTDALLATLQSRNLQGPVSITIMSCASGNDFDETSAF